MAECDRSDTVLVELNVHNLHLPHDTPGRIITFRVWITADDLVIHHKKLHIKYGGELYEISRMKQPFCGLTGINYWRAWRFADPDTASESSPSAPRSASA
jgi:hypothetical protein